MRSLESLCMAMALSLAACHVVSAQTASAAPLNCSIGPLSKTYGNTHWLAYACSDGQSVALITAPDNPAAPFYFFFAHTPKGLTLYGEGDGDKRLTDTAYNDMKLLSAADVALLYQQIKAAAHSDR